MLNSELHAASTAVSTHGRYSGRQPAMTAAIATFSTVTSTRSGGTVATMSDGARDVPVSMRITRCSVGGTTGRPSVHPRVNIISISSSAAAMSMRRGGEHRGAESHVERIDEVGVDTHRSAARPHHREIGSQTGDSGDALPLVTAPADRSLHLEAVDDANHRGHRLDLVVPTDGEIGVVDRRRLGGKAGVVLGVDRERHAVGELNEHRLDGMAGGAFLLDHHHDPVGKGGAIVDVCHGVDRSNALGEGSAPRSRRRTATCDEGTFLAFARKLGKRSIVRSSGVHRVQMPRRTACR